MIEQMNNIKLAVSAVLAGLTAIWGWFGWLVIFWVGCMGVDYITGTVIGCREVGWKSEIAFAGLWKKFGSIIAVGASAATDWIIATIVNNIPQISLPFEYSVFVCPLVLVWYSVTELGSIVENAGKTGARIPGFLRRIIAALEDGAESTGDKAAGGKGEE